MKYDALRGEAVNERRGRPGISVHAEVVNPERINGDEDHPLDVSRRFIRLIADERFHPGFEDYPRPDTCGDKEEYENEEDFLSGQPDVLSFT